MTRIDEHTSVTHTPGPWTVEDGYVVSEPLSALVGRGMVAVVYGHFVGEDDLVYTAEANLALIAAAPTLLAALRELVRVWDELPAPLTLPYEGLITEAEAVIAKAEGRSRDI